MLQLICFRSKYITGASIEVAGGLGVWNSSNATCLGLQTKDEIIKTTWNSSHKTIPRLNSVFCLKYSSYGIFNDLAKKAISYQLQGLGPWIQS